MADSQIRRSILGFDPEKNAHEMSAREWAACQAWLIRGKSLEQAKQIVSERLEQAERADAEIAKRTVPVEDKDWFKKAMCRVDGLSLDENGEIVTSAERRKAVAAADLERRKGKSEMDLLKEKYANASELERTAMGHQILARLGMAPKR